MSRDRLTITLDEALLTAVDTTIDGSAVRNRSHAIEHLIREGLHLYELSYIVLTAGGPTDAAILLQLAERVHGTNITHSVIISDPTHPTWAQELTLSLATLAPGLTSTTIPGDFGSAAAITLLADQLTTPFLFVKLGEATVLPTSFLPFYTEHRRNHKTVTHLLTTTDGASFALSGCSVISPDFVTHIPAGRAELDDVFPLLAKAGRVGTYVD